MNDAALFIGWDRPVAGKESMAVELFATAQNYFEKQQKKGLVESFEPVLISAHAGDLNGFMLVRGTPENLAQIRRDDEFLKIVIRCNVALTHFGVVEAYRGQSIKKVMDIYRQSI